jgi:hypothetical protein
MTGCSSNSNKKAVNAADLDSIMAEEAKMHQQALYVITFLQMN